MPPHDARDTIDQLHLTLCGITPVVWRRIQVRGSTPLPRLHAIFPHGMGWTDAHLHRFRVGDGEYGLPDPEYPDATKSERRVRREQIVHTVRDAFVYAYDFGDGWHHDVLVEAVLLPEPGQRSPVCPGGARACPPEDGGGTWGYRDYLTAMGDPTHHAHPMMREWIGGDVDAAAFNRMAMHRTLRPRSQVTVSRNDMCATAKRVRCTSPTSCCPRPAEGQCPPLLGIGHFRAPLAAYPCRHYRGGAVITFKGVTWREEKRE